MLEIVHIDTVKERKKDTKLLVMLVTRRRRKRVANVTRLGCFYTGQSKKRKERKRKRERKIETKQLIYGRNFIERCSSGLLLIEYVCKRVQ